MTPETSVQVQVDSYSTTINNRVLCPICQRWLNSPFFLQLHIQVKHSEEDYHICKTCGEGFSQKEVFTAHLNLHNIRKYSRAASFLCDVCSRAFSSSIRLEYHKKMTHSREQGGYSCNICNRTYTNPCYLKTHKTLHTGQKPFKCNTCQKRFRLKVILEDHMRVHTRKAAYSCDICQTPFLYRSQLIRHFKKHPGQDPYICSYCHHKSATKLQMNQHKMKEHAFIFPSQLKVTSKSIKEGHHAPKKKIGNSLDEASCPFCGIRCKDQQSLEDHLRFHVGECPFFCLLCSNEFATLSEKLTHVGAHSVFELAKNPQSFRILHQFREKAVSKI